jgi:hypothetical protein
MAILSVKKMKMALLAGLMLFSATSYGQENREKISKMELAALEMNRVQAEIDLLEREVDVYDKSIRENERIQEKYKDKAERLKYKVMSELSKMDTTVPHKMTYKEWQLEKANRERAHAATQLAKAQHSREEKVLALGEKTKELKNAQFRFYHSADINDISKRPSQRQKQKNKQPKDYKGVNPNPGR